MASQVVNPVFTPRECMAADAKVEVRRPSPSERVMPSVQGTADGDRVGFEPFITKPVVAERMDVEVRTVSRLMRRGVLRYYKLGEMVRFKWSEVEEDMREHFQVCAVPRRDTRMVGR